MSDPRASEPASGGAARRLDKYELLVCVCGGIAAYKTATVVSTLVQAGCGVTVAMTRNARRFVAPLTFQALTGRRVYTNAWRDAADGDMRHLTLSERADLVLVAPATANVIGKLAGGLADDLVSTLLLGADAPVILAPAMNVRMWNHPAVRRNVEFLRESGFTLAGPESGWLACRTVGQGRMVEAAELIDAVREKLLTAPPRSTA